MSSLTRIDLFVSSRWGSFVRNISLLSFFLSLVLSPVSTMAALVPLTGVTQISAGGAHTCALLNTGVLCWGNNSMGQLGNGTNTVSKLPVAVTGLSSGVIAIAAGGNHTCAVMKNGEAKCWGRNDIGQLGDGTKTTGSFTGVNKPVTVTGLNGNVTAIAATDYHTCALLSTGGVQCWGNGSSGELGDGKARNSNTPVAVTVLNGNSVKAITVGDYYTCALLSTGGVNCWGRNVYGQLGNSTMTNSGTAVVVTGLNSGVTTVATGPYLQHNCVTLETGGVKCWGFNDHGQLGNGTTLNSSTPITVTGLNNVTAITEGFNHTCALLSTGGVQCWGLNGYGQIGNGATTDSFIPVAVTGLSGVTAVAAGYHYTCALLNTSEVKCWGNAGGIITNDAITRSIITSPVFVMVEATTHSVTVNKTGTGSGTVSGGGNFIAGATVKLTATPDANSTFTGWSPTPCAESFEMPAQNLACTATFVPKITTTDCNGKHATFDTATGLVTIPAVDIPTLDPFTGESTGKLATFSAQLNLLKGVEDFGLVSNAFKVLQVDVTAHDPCHAEYTYADGKFSKGGTIHLPYVDVPSVIVIPPNTQIPGPVHVYDATLKQLALDLMIFHLADYKYIGTLTP